MKPEKLSDFITVLAFTVLATAHLAGCEQAAKTDPAVSTEVVPVQPVSACEALAKTIISGTEINATTLVASENELPEYCRIEGVIEPGIGFEARFPTQSWNGKYYQAGCGGFCGVLSPDKPGYSNTINEALKRGYAAIAEDGGHKGASMGDASWAKDNRQAEVVYAHTGVALVHAAGTSMVEAFYKQEANRSYFSGCSTGGRMAVKTAQVYPDLFDGILAGGGVLNLSSSGGIYGSWIVGTNLDEDGRQILDYRFTLKIPLLTAAATEQCDSLDGMEDGIIGAPQSCTMNVGKIPLCEGESTNQCLTALEAGVVSKWYQGPVNSRGEQLFPGIPPGSERYWPIWFLGTQERTGGGNLLGGLYVKYLGLEEDSNESYSVSDFDFDNDSVRLEAMGKLYNAWDPDLRPFRSAGGKMIMYHGLADPLVLPENSINYYESVVTEMGNKVNIDDFLRFFTVPGMGHCWEMPANTPDQFDPITALENWVEKGKAPAYMEAHALQPETALSSRAALCPYPGAAVNLSIAQDASTACKTTSP